MELGRIILRQFPRRLISGRCVVGKGSRTAIPHQQRPLSIIGFSNNHDSISCCNLRGISQKNMLYIRQFSRKDATSNSRSNNQGEDDDEITVIYGDQSEYDSTTDKSKFTHEVKVEMPDIGDQEGGVIEKWYKQPGDIIHRDDVICDIRTESFTFGMVTDDDFDSMMGEILVEQESGTVNPGTVIFTTFSEDKHHFDDGSEKDE